MTEELDRLLVDGNISWTADEIRKRLSSAGYAIVRKVPQEHWIVPDFWGRHPKEYYCDLIQMAENHTQ